MVAGVSGVDAESDNGGKIMNCTFLTDGHGIANMVQTGRGLRITNKRHSVFNVVFEKGQRFEGEPVIPTLHQLSLLVSGVINAIDNAYLARR